MIGDRDSVPDLSGFVPIASATHAGATLLDNMPMDLCFAPIEGSVGRTYAVAVSSEAEPGHAPTVWLSDAGERIAGHVAGFRGTASLGGFGLLATAGYAPALAPTPVPRHLLYSPITQCNLNCVHCISRDTRKTVSRLAGSVKDEIARWCREGHVESITTDYSGDLLWAEARFGGELDFLFGLGVPLSIDTNGAYLTPEVSRRLMESRVHALNVSLDTPDPDTYRWIRKGAPPLADVLQNVRALVAARDAAGAKDRVRLSLSFTIMRSTVDQWEDFVRLAAELGIGVIWSRHLEVYTPDLDAESLWHDQPRHNAAQGRVQALAAELGVRVHMQGSFEAIAPATSASKRWCEAPWTSAVVLGNGDVQVCCMPKTKIGNLNEASMEEIWTGPRYRAFRAVVNSDAPPTVCQVCPMFRQPNNPDSYLPYRRLGASRPP
ncbi:radical SAM protein, partial [Aureimonas sp. AU4]|uniref:radical SAM protein n=1 Tax=Aureimonas sp. AU4 TaxID=1638163 RepID=UPI00078238AE